MNKLKLLGIGILANFLENFILLMFFNIPIGKQMAISSLVFALVTVLIYKIIQNGSNEQ